MGLIAKLTENEIHSFLIGFSETLCPWKPHITCHCEQSETISHEYHYYLAGRALGFITLLLISIGIAKLVKEVLL